MFLRDKIIDKMTLLSPRFNRDFSCMKNLQQQIYPLFSDNGHSDGYMNRIRTSVSYNGLQQCICKLGLYKVERWNTCMNLVSTFISTKWRYFSCLYVYVNWLNNTHFLSSIEKCSLPFFIQSQPKFPDEQSHRQSPSSCRTFSKSFGHEHEITVAWRIGSGIDSFARACDTLSTQWQSVWLMKVCFSMTPCLLPINDTCSEMKTTMNVKWARIQSCAKC